MGGRNTAVDDDHHHGCQPPLRREIDVTEGEGSRTPEVLRDVQRTQFWLEHVVLSMSMVVDEYQVI